MNRSYASYFLRLYLTLGKVFLSPFSPPMKRLVFSQQYIHPDCSATVIALFYLQMEAPCNADQAIASIFHLPDLMAQADNNSLTDLIRVAHTVVLRLCPDWLVISVDVSHQSSIRHFFLANLIPFAIDRFAHRALKPMYRFRLHYAHAFY